MLKIAVIGGIGAGKSTACRIIRDEYKGYLFDSDKRVHDLLAQDPTIIKKVIQLFGDDIITRGVIDRAKVAKIVFNSPTLLGQYCNIIHPEVKQCIIRSMEEAEKSGVTIFVAEVPLLYEAKAEKLFDEVICVHASEQTRGERYALRKKDDFQARDALLHPSTKEITYPAHHAIENNSSLDEFTQQIKKIVDRII